MDIRAADNYLESKNRFFALYWGQYVAIQKNIKTHVGTNCYIGAGIAYLELKTLSQMNDEELMWVAEQVFIEDFLVGTDKGRIIEAARHHIKTSKDRFSDSRERSDYLRKKGYAVPYLTYSVQDLVDVGWIKLKE